MKCVAASNLLKSTDLIVNKIKQQKKKGLDPHIESYLAQYLTVHVCGVYEEAIEKIIEDYALVSGDSRIQKYIVSLVAKTFRNPTSKNINDLLKSFDASWVKQLASLKKNRFTAIDNIVNNKNAIAHGTQSAITLDDILKYYVDSKEIIRKIDRMLLDK